MLGGSGAICGNNVADGEITGLHAAPTLVATSQKSAQFSTTSIPICCGLLAAQESTRWACSFSASNVAGSTEHVQRAADSQQTCCFRVGNCRSSPDLRGSRCHGYDRIGRHVSRAAFETLGCCPKSSQQPNHRIRQLVVRAVNRMGHSRFKAICLHPMPPPWIAIFTQCFSGPGDLAA